MLLNFEAVPVCGDGVQVTGEQRCMVQLNSIDDSLHTTRS